jgi:magnesium transporter
MENLEFQEKTKLLQQYIAMRDHKQLQEMLEEMPTIEVCEFLEEKPHQEIIRFLGLLDYDNQGRIFSDFDLELQMQLFQQIDIRTFSEIFSRMYSDIRVDFYQELEQDEQMNLLPYLSKKIREDVITLSSYPPETAGGIMNTDFATILINMTAEEAIAKIRKDAPSQKMIYYIYVVDEKMAMSGLVTIKDLIFAEPQTKVEDILQEFFIYAEVAEDRESVAKKLEKYSLVAIPILNPQGQLVGIVNYDDAIDVIREEHTEDLEKFMGIVQTENSLEYIDTSVIEHFKKRIFWIAGLAAVGIISGMILHRFEGTLQKLIILAVYLPMMTDTGGNSGSQAATVVIRAMALDEISVSDWLKVLWKEARISFLISLIVGVLAYLKILFLSQDTPIPESFNLFTVASTITLALCLQVISSTIIGAALPLFVKRLGGDPAVVASPAITTVVDITGLLIYFGTVTLAFNL